MEKYKAKVKVNRGVFWTTPFYADNEDHATSVALEIGRRILPSPGGSIEVLQLRRVV